ncbi:phasin family protein [Alteromonas gilva]|uniref:Phasin family protein n=1 Tax=Alteromonas gilva TaxID=2987522 RepID=A0ABT5L6T5_9ALTE|nr:phasin family protein [Alteromonas gilva]MDC8832086.1 phasin family protein [Alteromonas gilva]
MLEQMTEKFQTAMKPVTELATLNMNTMQELAEKQNSLFSSLMSDGMSFVESASQQKDLMSLAEMQKSYFEGVQEKMTESAKSSYTLISETQQKAGDMLKGMSEEMTAKFTAK